MDGISVKSSKKGVTIDANQGGNKAAERGGANKGIVDHHMVDKIDHAKHSSRAKSAMGAEGVHNVEYYNGGKM